jgi:hypothetical protein
LVPELPDKDLLKAMAPNCSRETAKEALRLLFSKNKRFKLEYWKDVIFSINGKTLSKEAKEMRKKRKTFQDYLVEDGFFAEYEQAWEQRGIQKVLALLDEETRNKLKPALLNPV